MNTFFWGYFSTPWRRLFRTLSIIIFIYMVFAFLYNIEIERILLFFVTISIPLLSYLIEPFTVKKDNNNKKNKNQVIDTIIHTSNKKESLSKEGIREKGRKFLEELQKKGPDLSKVGKTVVYLKGSSNKEKNDDEFDYNDKTREFRKLKYDIQKEFPRKNDSNNEKE